MAKKLLIIATIAVVAVGLVYLNLPVEITRKSEIDFGNHLAARIREYQKSQGQLPEPEDWKTLEILGFKMETLGTDPTYERINNNEFELIYLKGFDGPYLLYNSKIDDWKIANPSVPDRWKRE